MTQISLSPAELAALKPCSDRTALFAGRNRMTAREALDAGATVADLLWVAGKLGLKAECVAFAIACAERVARLNPDPRVRAALDAAKAWLDDPTEENRLAAAAAAAADAAWAARAAERTAQREIFLTIFGGDEK